ncbi:MAG: hypothetical protein J6Z00_00115, partial [Clostridia bacterium]|nr:hypothetical protein [Clostridia bacterium]
IDFYDVDHLRYDPRTGEVVLACLPEMNPAYLIDGLRYYSIGIPGGVIAIADYPGDINGDNVLDMKDVLQFRQYLIGYDVAVRNVMNLNVDDAIDMKDLLVLRQLIISAAN